MTSLLNSIKSSNVEKLDVENVFFLHVVEKWNSKHENVSFTSFLFFLLQELSDMALERNPLPPTKQNTFFDDPLRCHPNIIRNITKVLRACINNDVFGAKNHEPMLQLLNPTVLLQMSNVSERGLVNFFEKNPVDAANEGLKSEIIKAAHIRGEIHNLAFSGIDETFIVDFETLLDFHLNRLILFKEGQVDIEQKITSQIAEKNGDKILTILKDMRESEWLSPFLISVLEKNELASDSRICDVKRNRKI